MGEIEEGPERQFNVERSVAAIDMCNVLYSCTHIRSIHCIHYTHVHVVHSALYMYKHKHMSYKETYKPFTQVISQPKTNA